MCYHANCFLGVVYLAACSFFEPVRLLPPPNRLLGASTLGADFCFPDWLKVVMCEGVVIAVCAITPLFFPEM